MKDYKDLVCELCDYFGFDDLFPYNNLEEIEKRFKEHLDNSTILRLDLIKAKAEINKLKK